MRCESMLRRKRRDPKNILAVVKSMDRVGGFSFVCFIDQRLGGGGDRRLREAKKNGFSNFSSPCHTLDDGWRARISGGGKERE